MMRAGSTISPGKGPVADSVRQIKRFFLPGGALAAAHPFGGAVLAWGLPALELVWALWLGSGKRPKGALAMTAAGFFGFSFYTLYKIYQGETNCGCFGAWEVSPKVTYWVDIGAFLVAVVAAFASRPLAGARTGWWLRWRLGLLLSGTLLGAAALYIVALTHAPAVELPPGQWVGQTWPAPGTIETAADFRSGRWVVLLYKAGCGRCRATAEDYADLAQLWRSEGRELSVALISTDPEIAPAVSVTEVVTGRFYEPQVYGTPPVVLVVVDGEIVGVHEGRGRLDWSVPPFASWLGR